MTQNLGKQGEQLTIEHLKKNKFKILEQNYRQFFGEIDIIARQGNTIAFVEVKTRRNSKVCLFELISPAKKSKIIKTAKHYIAQHCYNPENIIFRFDVALINYTLGNIPEISYIQNAF